MKLILSFIILIATCTDAKSCTTFVLKNDSSLVYGRNLDWVSDNGVVVVNKKNVRKSSLVFPPEKPTNWISKYGSISFNQFGKEFPFGGMNEKGLVVATMLVPGGVPKLDNKTAVNELQWVQYQLDNAATIEEVITNCARIRVSTISQNLHYLILDKLGNSLVVEFDKKGTHFFKGNDLPIAVLENDTYLKSLSKSKKNTHSRFNTAANLLKQYHLYPTTPSPVNCSFSILEKVKLAGSWSIVFDVNKLEIHFKTSTNAGIRKIKLDQFDFSCSTPSLLYDMQLNNKGNINAQFIKYSNSLNIKKFNSATASNRITLPPAITSLFHNYSSTCNCVTK